MKKAFVLLCALLLVLGMAPAVFAIPVKVTYTADNVVGAWYQDGSAPVTLSPGPNAGDWTKSDTDTLELVPGTEYQLAWIPMLVYLLNTTGRQPKRKRSLFPFSQGTGMSVLSKPAPKSRGL